MSATIAAHVMQGKVAVVTGAGSGIGRASALAFAAAGARVVVSDVAAMGGEETVRLIRERGGEATPQVADVANAAEVEALIAMAVRTYGRLDYAHNNAGIGGPGVRTEEYTEEQWDRVLSVNLKGVWLCLKYEIARMRDHGGGSIVNTASTSALFGGSPAAYVASKHGVAGLTKTAAIENAPHGIRINAICPGAIQTPMVEGIMSTRPEWVARVLARTPAARLGSADEVAAVVVWLCSDAASYVTGTLLSVDGGRVAG